MPPRPRSTRPPLPPPSPPPRPPVAKPPIPPPSPPTHCFPPLCNSLPRRPNPILSDHSNPSLSHFPPNLSLPRSLSPFQLPDATS
ncbi:hypothetical protein WJX73_000110 [Symbiochloris irregularis]|uniref:Uncharacterized protein n=1 Tax=Symbiochloris irregularis TaxID=706552 RepID=A0AAW1NZM7_9CHLO